MDHNSTSESSVPPHYTVLSPSHYTGRNDLASLSLAGFVSIQGSEGNVGPSSHPPHPYTHSHEHLFVPGYVPSMPNIPHCQEQSYPQPVSLLGKGLPSQMDFCVQLDTAQARWRDANRQMKQAELATHNPFTLPQWNHRLPGPSAPMEPPSTIILDMLPSEHHNEPDDNPATDRDDMEGVSPEASTKPSKKRKDMLRKRNQRADDRQHFTRICKLLKIPLSPKNTLAQRILVAVDQLVKQRKLDDALRRRLGEGEIDLAVLREELAQDSNDTAPGVPNIEAIPSHGLCPMGRGADEGHN